MFIKLKMSKSWNFVIVLVLVSGVLLPSPGFAKEQEIKTGNEKPFFKMQDLYGSIRIPKIVVAPDGSILAFNACANIYRRSEDKGETWSEVKKLASGGNVIVDKNVGHVLVLDPHSCEMLRSKDSGKTWEKEKIEKVLPNPRGHGRPDGVYADVYCSESGITLQYGKYKGRLIMPVRIRPFCESGRKDYSSWFYHYNSAIYSDDGGKVWQTGGPVQSGTGEGALAELSDGSIYYNSRSHLSCDDRRRIAWSYDGGEHFGDWSASDELYETSGTRSNFRYGKRPSYGRSCGLARMPDGTTQYDDVLIFACANEGLRYERGSRPKTENFIDWSKIIVQVSFDREETWPVSRHIPHGGVGDYASITVDDDGVIYLLFEKSDPPTRSTVTHVTFAKFNLAWLKEGDPPDWTKGLTGVFK